MHLRPAFLADDFVAFINNIKDFLVHGLDLAFPLKLRVRLTNPSRLTASARISAGMPARVKADSSASRGQSCLRSLSIILRRCEKLRLTICRKTRACSDVSSGLLLRTSFTHAESTSGSGKKHEAGILNMPSGSY